MHLGNLLFVPLNVTRASSKHVLLSLITLWSGTIKNSDVGTGPLTCLFACLLALLTHSLAPHCSLCTRTPLCSTVLICSLAHSLNHSWARGKVDNSYLIRCLETTRFCPSVHNPQSLFLHAFLPLWYSRVVPIGPIGLVSLFTRENTRLKNLSLEKCKLRE